MVFVFLDDCKQISSRPGLAPLVAVGGIVVKASQLRSFISEIDKACSDAGFPSGEKFKWSPGKELWMSSGLKGSDRADFFKAIIAVSKKHEVEALVVCEEEGNSTATGAATAELDVIKLILEKVEAYCQKQRVDAMVIFDRPGGGMKEVENFLGDCMESIIAGTNYVKNERLLVPPLASPSAFCRPLQVADLVVSSTTAAVSGEDKYSAGMVKELKELYYQPRGYIAGWGVKLWPKWRLTNLYHWVLGEKRWHQGTKHIVLPSTEFNYAKDPKDANAGLYDHYFDNLDE